MESERRRCSRVEVCNKVLVKRKTEHDRYEEVPLYLRDISHTGMSGTYFGARSFGVQDAFFVDNGDECHPLKLVWSCSSLDTVHMAGFELDGSVGGVSLADRVCAS